jgi:hypothetical protein
MQITKYDTPLLIQSSGPEDPNEKTASDLKRFFLFFR